MLQHKNHLASVTSIATKEVNHFLTAKDGTSIHYQFWLPQNVPMNCIILCIPGFNSDTKYFGAFATHLRGRGMGVYSFDLRGFGKSGGKASIARSLEDVQMLVDHIKNTHPGVPLHLLGHSVGAIAYAMQYAIRNPHEIKSLVLVAPATKIRNFIWLNHLFRSLGIPLQLPLTDPEAGEIKIGKSGERIRYSTFHVLDIRIACNFRSQTNANLVQVPTLIIKSDREKDVIVDSDDMLELSRRIPNSMLIDYANAGHLVFTSISPKVSPPLEAERLKVYEDICAWLAQQ